MNKNFKSRDNRNVTVSNKQIRYEVLRVVGSDGEALGVMSKKEALSLAYESDLDLILITEKSDPPVAKIANLNKYNYELKKREKELAKNARASVQEVKEVKFRIGIGENDLLIKTKQISKFLSRGAKVKITIQLRGREIAKGSDAVQYFTAILNEHLENFKFDQPLKQAGNRITGMIING